ncbi:glycoside hydrolase family 99-like domain-containing protein [Panacibacter sp. DH6]|uniref:Glycoside hydrolase family 99-like domain-containing protein n=1 Tax=Panacibacter microcysteis TaxID=2793269 RepID=A0A931GY18_9BACT|nr:glycoside hydrolase family 99-like domain-containing protein [Panacibacter microcysteis]MBG9377144.1 glycoside hydrolase family 99-like domain-containing protein [Panacibacter microcysteis]
MHPRLIAYYLPQYHPIPENDKWWGKGFTEWTNVTKAKPLYRGHHQPHYPADLGYYDLRVPEVREAQAQMAKRYGIEGFMYYHYWFGDGKKLLERPYQDMLHAKSPDLPFCLCWANESWKGVWFGEFTGQMLIEQTYPGTKDIEAHFYYLLEAFKDDRYIKVDGKPLFNVYMPLNLPDAKAFAAQFNALAIKEGLPGLYLVGSRVPFDWNPHEYGFDAVIGSEMAQIRYRNQSKFKRPRYAIKRTQQIIEKITGKEIFSPFNRPAVVEYAAIIDQLITTQTFDFDYYPCVIPNWDNTPRAGNGGLVFQNSTPALFEKHLLKGIEKVQHLPPQRQLVFVKSWNEWAEGNYLEPDRTHGYAYLESVKRVLDSL